MTRDLASWAQPKSGKSKLKLTWPKDLVAALRSSLRRWRPADAPAPAPSRPLSFRANLSTQHLALRLLGLRLDVELVGADTLTGMSQPVIFAANEQGALDYQVLRAALPGRLRPLNIRLSRTLSKGRNVVVFTDEPASGRLVGEFSTVPADLANQYNVAIIPVGLAGTFKLKDVLKLSLRTKPKVSVRFGAPIYVRGRTLTEATEELQVRVEHLVHEGDLSWWTVERRRQGVAAPVAVEPTARWRRLWEQAAPKPERRSNIWR
ncbi:MAG TPA: hypothetical protein K8V15_01935 [Tessaracoccus flavescens]|uniref:Phospholipid/glycerol acyltransferase domain-containing protein n=1 Tax=Tessaracoccus flavescens TaxID=399497 RepID=A0A921JQ64_9ACTN|nr:hypothetical protein [Tessaracoccus flavescens]